jgi:hypothetical protein
MRVRLRKNVLKELRTAAKQNDRSLNDEIMRRLEQSLMEDRVESSNKNLLTVWRKELAVWRKERDGANP